MKRVVPLLLFCTSAMALTPAVDQESVGDIEKVENRELDAASGNNLLEASWRELLSEVLISPLTIGMYSALEMFSDPYYEVLGEKLVEEFGEAGDDRFYEAGARAVEKLVYCKELPDERRKQLSRLLLFGEKEWATRDILTIIESNLEENQPIKETCMRLYQKELLNEFGQDGANRINVIIEEGFKTKVAAKIFYKIGHVCVSTLKDTIFEKPITPYYNALNQELVNQFGEGADRRFYAVGNSVGKRLLTTQLLDENDARELRDRLVFAGDDRVTREVLRMMEEESALGEKIGNLCCCFYHEEVTKEFGKNGFKQINLIIKDVFSRSYYEVLFHSEESKKAVVL